MKPGRPSETALRVAANQVAAAREPELRRLLAHPDDPHWERCIRAHSLRARFRLAVWKFGPARRLIYRLSDAVLPGGPVHLLLRKRYVEETVRAALEDGAGQAVILGAGFDPLALRLGAEFPDVRCFEVDHPDTQSVKRRALEARGGLPENLVLVPLDLVREPFDARLRAAAGFQPEARSVFLAEGLLMYLPPEDVDALFAGVRRNSTPGSRFIFSVLDAALLAQQDGSLADVRRFLERLGEPLRSGQDRRGLDGFLRRHGFRRRALADHRTLRAAYLAPLGMDRALLEGELLVVAEAV